MTGQNSPAAAIRPMREGDWSAVRRIYREGIETGHATFETEPPEWEYFDGSRLPDHRLVAETEKGLVLGWAAVSAVSSRPAYAGVVEHSIYVSGQARGLGVGTALLKTLTVSTELAGIWTIQASVFPENQASLKLHLAQGFRIVGRRERISRSTHGPRPGQWRDTLLIERRSAAI